MMPDTSTQNQLQSHQGEGGNGLGGETTGLDALAGTDVPGMAPPINNPDARTNAQGQEPPAVDETHVGKKVFSPNELNQAGEDKEYFHPDGGHKFNAPQDANAHALGPDVEVTPDNKVKPVS